MTSSTSFQSVKGMDDLVSPEVERWQILEASSRAFFESFGFREIRTPIVESAGLFARSIGEASDIVHKEMYTFQDRAQRSLALRPEMTAAVVRAALQHGLIKDDEPCFVYYIGPMFRAERPQAGRKRQFHQIGVETLNTHSASNDAELLIMISAYLKSFGLERFTVKINHLGSEEDRADFVSKLKKYFEASKEKLCGDCHYRLAKNVLRIFDCKVEACRGLAARAPKIQLSPESAENLESITSSLNQAKFPYVHDSTLVRGLDYYTGFVFEVVSEGLGAQDALLAGGRYDSLIHDLGGPKKGASGFSIGVERLLSVLAHYGVHFEKEIQSSLVYVALLIDQKMSCILSHRIALGLYKAKKRAHFSFSNTSLKNHLSRANKMGVGHVLIVGEDELAQDEISLKNMMTGEQKRFKLDLLANAFESKGQSNVA